LHGGGIFGVLAVLALLTREIHEVMSEIHGVMNEIHELMNEIHSG
jgi:hypothetical protein